MRRLLAVLSLLVLVTLAPSAHAAVPPPPATPVASGAGGAAASVDPYATKAAIEVLRHGGNAVDAAIAAAGVLGVVEPFSSGLGGGGFMVIRDADGSVRTIDGRETAPAAFTPTSFIDPATGQPYPFAERVESGLGVGVPGTLRTWEQALDRYGTWPLRRLLHRAIQLARDGFVVDKTFSAQVDANKDRFDDFTSTAALYLPNGAPPPAGSELSNPDLGALMGRIARRGPSALYRGETAQEIVDAVQHPPLAPGANHTVRPGVMTSDDLAGYEAKWRAPTQVGYRGMDVYGMGPPSSGGSTVGEALNILEGYGPTDATTTLHHYLEASKLAFADRNAYLGDPDYVDVPLGCLLSDPFAAQRRALIAEDSVLPAPQAPGDCGEQATSDAGEGPSTTHLTVADADGNVVSYTFTIEQTGGSAIVAPGTGLLLNNELTDFEPTPGLPNSPAAGKRPRSSMSPTIIERDGKPLLALGSPGGATIITTVLQILLDRFELGMTLPDAIAAPRASQRNGARTDAEPAFLATPEASGLQAKGHVFNQVAEIGAATGIEFGADGALAAAEPVRRGGGSAMAIPTR